MHQLELKLFWPLQEQILLDLDHYEVPNTLVFSTAPTFLVNTVNSGSTGLLTINTDEVVFRTKQPQSFFQRWFFGLLGLKVEKV